MIPSGLPAPVWHAAHEVERTRTALGDADDRHRASRALLAAEIRRTAKDAWSVDALCDAVAERMGLSPRTVLNALYETFRLDVFEHALEVLADVVTRRQAA